MVGAAAGESAWHYLDHAASTPMRPEAIAAMVELLAGDFGNPSGAHALARGARARLDGAREDLASAVGCQPGEIVFTSGGTEADNLAIRGALGDDGGTAVCLATDHHAVLHVVERTGGQPVGVDRRGVVDLEQLADALNPQVVVVSVALVNNEVGTIQPLDQVARLVRERAPQALLHTDAAQALSWLDVREHAATADLVTLASHKCGGPRGMGALVVRAGARLQAQQIGGGQERDLRSGTQDVASAVAFAVAATTAAAARPALVDSSARRREALVNAVSGGGARRPRERGAGRRSVAPRGRHRQPVPAARRQRGAALPARARAPACSASAASSCASGAQEPSHVLAADGHRSGAGRRIAAPLDSVGPTTDEDVAAAVAGVPAVAQRLQHHARGGAPA